MVAAAMVLALGVSACGNSGDDDDSAEPAGGTDTGSGNEASSADRDEFVSLDGVPGVTDDAITYSVIGTKANNPLGTCILDCYVQGIEAYFAYRNDEGGIYGRDLELADPIDDELQQNQARALEVTSANDTFGNFNATLFASGWGDLDSAGIPTYTWGINFAEANGRPHIWGSIAEVCGACTGRTLPLVAQAVGAHKVAALGYGITENSKLCASSYQNSFDKYGEDVDAEVVYLNDDLDYGLPSGIGPEVSEMKDAGVDLIATCLDLNAMKTIAQELDRQGMQDVILYHPNTYNQAFVEEAGDLFEGDVVAVQFRPFEADEGDGAGIESMNTFRQWMEETGSDLSELAMVGWINADQAFQGLLAAGPEFDRDKVTEATNEMTAFDAGGLINPIDWTRQHEIPTEGDPAHDYARECSALLRVESGKFVPMESAAEPWACWSNESDAWSDPTATSFG
jgi:ABC-type branched-subunit amino acid transport system substrate-binding protein